MVNNIAWALLSSYHVNNLLASNFTIFSTCLLIYFISRNYYLNAYRISLQFVLFSLWVVNFLLALFMQPSITDNYLFLILIALLFVQVICAIILFFITDKVSNRSDV